jgi:LPXTG-motif cell wall-anchored protein
MATEAMDGADGIDRRALLKRGAVIGATAAWTIPIVQAISVTPAHADTTSAPPTKTADVPPVQGGLRPSSTTRSSGGPTAIKNDGALASTGEQAVAGVAIGAAALAVGAGLVAGAKRKKHNEDTQPSS